MYGGAWMWNPNNNKTEEQAIMVEEEEEEEDDDESWEVKAFEQDTKGNFSGTAATWPPRSYTCNFCRREFRSAQALGGHMNVHRRDRASRAHLQAPNALTAVTNGQSGGGACVPPFIIQSNEGLSHFYQFQNPNGIFGNSGEMMMNLYGTTSFPTGNIAFSVLDSNANSPVEEEDESIGFSMKETKGTLVDELDLELRLGHNPP